MAMTRSHSCTLESAEGGRVFGNGGKEDDILRNCFRLLSGFYFQSRPGSRELGLEGRLG